MQAAKTLGGRVSSSAQRELGYVELNPMRDDRFADFRTALGRRLVFHMYAVALHYMHYNFVRILTFSLKRVPE